MIRINQFPLKIQRFEFLEHFTHNILWSAARRGEGGTGVRRGEGGTGVRGGEGGTGVRRGEGGTGVRGGEGGTGVRGGWNWCEGRGE